VRFRACGGGAAALVLRQAQRLGAAGHGCAGLGYIVFDADGARDHRQVHPAGRAGDDQAKAASARATRCSFAADKPARRQAGGRCAHRIGEELGLVAKDRFEFCWIVDFPMYEWNEEEKKIDFSHNRSPCPTWRSTNSSRSIRRIARRFFASRRSNTTSSATALSCPPGHPQPSPDVMRKAFAIAGYGEDTLEQKFGGMLHALSLGAPPHGGIAPGIDRIVMLLCGEENLREVVLFPMNQRAEDLMMGAPSEVTPKQLRELHIRLNLPEKG
jgi:aspartyl-tRNA synthetase